MTTVKDIPFFVTDKFLRTYATNKYQLTQVERMVEQSYKGYLVKECKNQKSYKQSLEKSARGRGMSDTERDKMLKKSQEFELSRCIELKELFGVR